MIQFLQNRYYWWGYCVVFVVWVTNLIGLVSFAQTTPCPTLNPPVIQGTATVICRGATVQLSATGCSSGVVWSTGDTIPSITVQPQRTTRYTAVCRASKNCISCFADVYIITVNTPDAPVVTPTSTIICSQDEIVLTASGCPGTIIWSNQATGNQLTVKPQQTTSFQGFCQKAGCISSPSLPAFVQISTPTKPILTADQSEVCPGQEVRLTAANCPGKIRWSDGVVGVNRLVKPTQTTNYRAICIVGSCRSDSAEVLTIRTRSSTFKPPVLAMATNGCPYQTADLTRLIQESAAATLNGNWLFKTGPSLDAPSVQSPMAVEAGQYYIIFQDSNGCYSEPTSVSVAISACANAIPVCISNPPRLLAWVDTLDVQRGFVRVKGQLRGSALTATWQSTGNGLLIDPTTLTTRYLFSEEDRQRGSVMLTLSTPDPDGTGSCVGATASLNVTIPDIKARPAEVIGLSKKVFDPIWMSNTEVELTYQLTVANLGKNPLTALQLSDDLDRAFSASGVRLKSVSLKADDGLSVNTAYTGRGIDTTMLAGAVNLPVGSKRNVYLTVRIDVSQANTLTFENLATAWATDINNDTCLDRSTNGTDPDPDHNGNPADNTEPTVIALQALPTEVGAVFIPEGFSPNSDGINDRFVIQRVPVGTTVELEVFNRWGQVVYRDRDYKNDWNGIPNQGAAVGASNTGLPDGTYFYIVRLSDGKEFARFLTLSR